MLKEGNIKKLNELSIGKWIPDYCLVRTEEGWKLPSELTKREKLLVYDKTTKLVKAVFPKSYNKISFKGKLIGYNKIVFKDVLSLDNQFFIVSNLIEKRAFTYNEIEYSGFMYSFDIDPIVAYEYKISKVNNNNLLKLEYIL